MSTWSSCKALASVRSESTHAVAMHENAGCSSHFTVYGQEMCTIVCHPNSLELLHVFLLMLLQVQQLQVCHRQKLRRELYLYGTCFDCCMRAEMTLPSSNSDLLMFWASVNVSPVAPVLVMRSLPAKSQRVSLPTVRTPDAASVAATLMTSKQWLRLLLALIS